MSRLVGVLALNQEAGDLGALIGLEARSIRREVHRELMETIERREQMVWVPVTVATLIPGVIFLVVPFVRAQSVHGLSAMCANPPRQLQPITIREDPP